MLPSSFSEYPVPGFLLCEVLCTSAVPPAFQFDGRRNCCWKAVRAFSLPWLGWLALLRGVTLGVVLRPPSERAESYSPFTF